MAATLKVYNEAETTAKIDEAKLTGWYREDGWLRRKYTTGGWQATLLAVNAVGFLCEAADHHADLAVSYAKFWVKLQTHSAGGITDKDFELARKIEDTVLWKPTEGALAPGKSEKFVMGR